MKKQINFPIVLWTIFACLYGLLLCNQIDFTGVDLGRHLQNGKWVWAYPDLLRTNFYSYTFPTFPFLNHHWGSGVLLFHLWNWFGWEGLSIAFLAMSLFCSWVVWKQAEDVSPQILFIASLLFLPMLRERSEVRPEIFSYLCVVIFLYSLKRSKDFPQLLWLLPILQVLWVNLHIYFILGPIFILIYAAQSWAETNGSSHTKKLSLLFLAVCAASCINPFGVWGAIAPFRIFENYGHQVFENHSVFYLATRWKNPMAQYMIGLQLLLALTYRAVLLREKKVIVSEVCLLGLMCALVWSGFRHCALFSLVLIPCLARWWDVLCPKSFLNQWGRTYRYVLIVLISLVGIYSVSLARLPAPWGRSGIGLMDGCLDGITFFREHQLKGPICNNFNVGSALIWGLGDQEKVFVDNRPEAYPDVFFKHVYGPMQRNEVAWQKLMEVYQFNAIFFSRNDATPSAIGFISRRLDDPLWALVYVDPFSIIMLKRIPLNAELIRQFEPARK